MNPYRVAEKVGNVILVVVGAALVLLFLALAVFAVVESGWGWWGLLAIPGILVGFVILTLIVGALKWIEGKWRKRKYQWDRRNQTKEHSNDQ